MCLLRDFWGVGGDFYGEVKGIALFIKAQRPDGMYACRQILSG